MMTATTQRAPARAILPAEKRRLRPSKRAWGHADGSTLGGRIQLARVQNGMTQAEFAAAIGSTRVCVASIECGNGSISFKRAVAICEALDVSLDYLAGLSPDFGKFPLGDEAC
jgi:DNA-binding XRE family transcriptional regulator